MICPAAHGGPRAGRRARHPSPCRTRPRDRRGRDAGGSGAACWRSCGGDPLGLRRGRRSPQRRQVDAGQLDRRGRRSRSISDKPQTTRRAIRGVVNGELEGERWQLVLVDLPGVQRPRDALTERMQRRVERELSDCDAALFVLNGAERIGGGDRFIASALGRRRCPSSPPLNKVDLLAPRPRRIARHARTWSGGRRPARDLPGARPRRARRRDLVERLARLLPEGPLLYPDDVRSATSRSRRRWRSWSASRRWPARARRCRTRSRLRCRRSSGRDDLTARQGGDLGRDRVAERNPGRKARQHGARDRDGRAQGDGDDVGPARVPGPDRSSAPWMAPRRGRCSTGSASRDSLCTRSLAGPADRPPGGPRSPP